MTDSEEQVKRFGVKFWHPWSRHWALFIWIGWWKLTIQIQQRTDITKFAE